MKKILLILIVIMVSHGLFASNVKRGRLWNTTISPGLFYGGAIGYGKYL